MQQLIKITEKNGNRAVSARELYEFLEVKTDFKDWMPRMLEYGFEENEDFSSFLSESTGGRPSKEYVLTIDTAKEISMLQRTEKGKQARRYFIEMEKVATNQIENTRISANDSINSKGNELKILIKKYLNRGDIRKVATELEISDREVSTAISLDKKMNKERQHKIIDVLFKKAFENKQELVKYNQMIDLLK